MSARDSLRRRPSEREARAGARGPLEVDDAERRAEFPVRLRFEVERARLADAAHFLVVGGARADRHARGRQVRYGQQERAPLLVDRVEVRFELLDLLPALAVGGERAQGRPAGDVDERDAVTPGRARQ